MKEKARKLVKKQPVVVLVGHIDHGKSSILQKIRDFKITEKETGGITQHVGAYEVAMPAGRQEEKEQKITFIDTPGHEAFSAMRMRGAKVADIAILVIAADQGIKPQTKEAISHIKKAEIPMIVAINKIDKPSAGPERIKDELSRHDVLVEQRGGKVPSIEVSAETGKGIKDLLEVILLVAEMENLEADISKNAQGVVIESYLDSKKGPIAVLLLEQGILKQKQIIGTGSAIGTIKRMEDFQEKQVKQVSPGQPVLVLGFKKAPIMGEKFETFKNLEQAGQKIKEKQAQAPGVVEKKEDQRILNLILKTDVLGSIEPIEQVLKTLPQEKVVLRILKKQAGDINLSDIKLAETSPASGRAGRAVILGFRVKTPKTILETARIKRISILSFDLVYDLVEGIRDFMQKVLAPELVRTDFGTLKTLLIFRTEKSRQIVGARVLDGEIRQGLKIEIFRASSAGEEEMVGKGKVIALQRNKKEIGKGAKGDEVGILYEGATRIQENDILKVYEEKKQKMGL